MTALVENCYIACGPQAPRFTSLSAARKRFTQPYPLGFFWLVLALYWYETLYRSL